MQSRFAQIAFTPSVKQLQARDGSRASYARGEGGQVQAARLDAGEAAFIAGRDSFYIATVSETGWPYLQHRGGPRGFLKVLDAQTLAFADFQGNRQHVSEGNLAGNDRAALFLMDYPSQRRLKVLGRVRVVDAADDPALAAALTQPGYRAKVERIMRIQVEAFDWNCPQHITPRFSESELEPVLEPLRARIRQLEEQLAFASSV